MIEINPSSIRHIEQASVVHAASLISPSINASNGSTLTSLAAAENDTCCHWLVEKWTSFTETVSYYFELSKAYLYIFWFSITEALKERPQEDSSPEARTTEILTRIISQYRSSWQGNIEINAEVGCDQRINPAHFSSGLIGTEAVPEPPAEDIGQLLRFFEQMNTTDPQNPFYLNPALVNDEDTPANLEQLRTGLETFLNQVEHNQVPRSDVIKRYLQHICHFFSQPDTSREAKIDCLLGLARAGHRGCPTRMMGESQTHYHRMARTVQIETLPDQIRRILHDIRLGIIEELSQGDVHRRGELLLSIGTHLGIQQADTAYNDDPGLIIELAPQRSFPLFFRAYTKEKIIEVIKESINGLPIEGRPAWERAARTISTTLVSEWFRDNVPADFQPALPPDERVGSYLEHVLDADTNTIKDEAIDSMLARMQILN
ncbi:MAG: hypothetical protein KF898_01485 [Parachlamydiales bacterium]|nr:hypothetical protein [Candidatus Acheromyda pituitae]